MPEEKPQLSEGSSEKEDKKDEKEKVVEGEVVVDKLPPEVKSIMQFAFSSQRFSSPIPPQFLEKINEKHIDKMLEIAATDDTNSFKDAQSSKRYNLGYVCIFVALFVFVTIFLAGTNSELYKEILKNILIFMGGVGSGYGFKAYKEHKKD